MNCTGFWLRPILLIACALGMSGAPAQGQSREIPALSVNYVSLSSVYVDGGRAAGLEVGDRLKVLRDGVVIAELEVAYVAEHSASCRIHTQQREVQSGDRVVPVARKAQVAEPPAGDDSVTAPPVSGDSPPAVTIPEPFSRTPPDPRPWGRATGSVSFRFQMFRDATYDRDFDESTVRLNLRLRELGGRPFDLRMRLRGRQTDRSWSSHSASERSDRFYELALTYDPPEGKFSFQLGRLGASPFVSLGYLDGFVGQYRFHRRFAVGGFYGRQPEIAELGFESSGEKYGGFLRWNVGARDSGFWGEGWLAGIGEYDGGEVSREYVAIESRFGSGRRWSIFQRAEIDVHNDWRAELSGDSYQISNLSLSGSFRPRDNLRIALAYDQRKRYRTLDTRPIPEDLFDDKLREGYRASVYFGKPGGWNLSTTFGYRSKEGQGDSTTSFAGSIYHSNFRNRSLHLGANVSAYRGELTEGTMLTLQARKVFRGGHDVGLTLGASTTSVSAIAKDRMNQWIRLVATLRTRRRLYLRAELEYDAGDDLEGQRAILELGYRF